MLWLIGRRIAAGPEARGHHVVTEMVAEAQRLLGTSVVGVIDLWKQPEALTTHKKKCKVALTASEVKLQNWEQRTEAKTRGQLQHKETTADNRGDGQQWPKPGK